MQLQVPASCLVWAGSEAGILNRLIIGALLGLERREDDSTEGWWNGGIVQHESSCTAVLPYCTMQLAQARSSCTH
jgi:hypothetical protein